MYPTSACMYVQYMYYIVCVNNLLVSVLAYLAKVLFHAIWDTHEP